MSDANAPDIEQHFDLVVIGAGINGAGIARDAAMRGLSVAVVEQNDLCSGTSAWSSRLIHGGLRYLEYGEIPLVFESLHERRRLRQIAPHLVKPLRITIPIYQSARRGPWLVRMGMLAYDLLSAGKRMPGHEMLGRDELLAEAAGVNADGLRAAARYYDAQVRYAERLVLENLLAAKAAGAEVRLYERVERLEVSDGRIRRVHTIGTLDEKPRSMSAKVVVNAAGPWVDSVLATAPDPGAQLIGGTKGSHIVVSAFDGAPADAFYVEAHSDGRPFFILPWNGLFLIGTTDIRYEGRLGDLRASDAEIDYLLAETNRVFPRANLKRESVHYAYAGVRPLPKRDKGPESAITRRHIIKANKDVAANLLSIIGGKLTTYRHLAEQTVDRVGKQLKRRLPDCRTQDTPLPGGWGEDRARQALARLPEIDANLGERLLAIYGGRAARIAELVAADASLAAVVGGRVHAAEVALAFADEFAHTLTDVVHRRLMIGLDADQGRPLYAELADIAARVAGWSAAEREAELVALNAYSDSLRPA